ncbi:hypothetical protein I553_3835 [Mycobacterium xenopi 4042]|uniref:Uncharacterized protein n=1 Tax=Mycobacterium xenopi 4042 TaxID=1299334 RepID=X7YSY9_MYCXE|nr:hypothetical protein I553_3835 [Mycobacterium xenopi 4042]
MAEESQRGGPSTDPTQREDVRRHQPAKGQPGRGSQARHRWMATDFRTTAVRGSGAADQGGVEPTIRWPQQAHSASGGELVPTQPLSSSSSTAGEIDCNRALFIRDLEMFAT